MNQNYLKNSQMWANRSQFSYLKFFLLAVIGSFFIGIGYFCYHIVISNSETFGKGSYFFASAIFPVGIVLNVFFAGSLFTLDTAMSLKYFERKIKIQRLLIIWSIVLAGNFLGSFLIAGLCLWANLYESEDMQKVLKATIDNKTNINWYAALGSGIICGILVGGTVWIVNALNSSITKFFIIWIIITVFVISGTQHVVANMYIFALGWLKQMEFSSIGAIFENLIPTMMGNWIGGAILVPGIGFLLNYLSLQKN